MTLELDIPGRGRVAIEHVLFDVNGTLTDRGELIDGVAERLAQLGAQVQVMLVSADTFGTLAEVGERLGAAVKHVAGGNDKLTLVHELGPDRTAVVGNGSNDGPALAAAALGIAVLGPEGTSGDAIRAADVLCASILDALDLLLDARMLVATLRL